MKVSLIVGNRKRCSICKLYLLLSEFKRDSGQTTGLRPECIDCRKRKEKNWSKEHKSQIALAQRKCKLKRDFNLTLEAYEQLFKKQNGCCLLCEQNQLEAKRRLSVDHDHKTGNVRGLLCNECNTGLGKFQDDPQLLHKAAQYIILGGNVPCQYL